MLAERRFIGPPLIGPSWRSLKLKAASSRLGMCEGLSWRQAFQARGPRRKISTCLESAICPPFFPARKLASRACSPKQAALSRILFIPEFPRCGATRAPGSAILLSAASPAGLGRKRKPWEGPGDHPALLLAAALRTGDEREYQPRYQRRGRDRIHAGILRCLAPERFNLDIRNRAQRRVDRSTVPGLDLRILGRLATLPSARQRRPHR